MTKKFFIIIMLLATALVARAFDFSHAAVTGQMLYFDITGASVKVVSPGWDYYTKPAGSLVIPASVEHGGVTYSVTAIGESAFEECIGMTRVVVPEGVTSIGGFAFYLCSSLDTIELPSTLTEILSQAFSQTAYAANAANRDEQGLLYIGNYLIGGSARTDITIADGTLGIAGMAFYYNHTIEHLTLPASLRFIAGQAFSDCIQLDTIRCLGSTPPHAWPNSFLQTPSFVVAVPCGASDAYGADPVWGSYTVVEDCTGPVQGVDDVAVSTLRVAGFAGGVEVVGAMGGSVAVVDVMGRMVARVAVAEGRQRIALPAAGVYLLSVDGGKPVKVISY